MFNATYFTYDGVVSARYKLKISSFDDNSTLETNVFSQEITTSKPLYKDKYVISSMNYSGAPEVEVSVLSAVVIDEMKKREILAWLCQGDSFKKLIIHKPEVENFYYMCKFKSVSEITVNGYCVGFKLTAVLDSPYQYGLTTSVDVANGTYAAAEYTILNKSDFTDRYIYPILKFKLNNTGNVTIVNVTDDVTREFIITDVPAGNEIIIDNDLKIIDGEGAFLSKFNKNWLRLKKGENKLQITIDGELNITCPQIAHICF